MPLPLVGHTGVLHAPAAQSRSQAQADPQDTFSHASVPEHVIEHFASFSQVMSAHALPPVQWIVHSQPDGHVTLLQLSALVHSAVHVRATSSHSVQSRGQPETTQ